MSFTKAPFTQTSFTKSRLAVAVMAVTAGLACAEETPDQQATLINQVTVSATRSDNTLAESGKTIEVVGGQTIEEEQPESVAQALNSLPNVTVSGGPRATSQSVNIRGLEGVRVLQVVDGVRQNFSNGHRGTYFLDPELLKSVEVVKGPASNLWGSDAIGGVVVQNTKDAKDFLEPDETIGGYVSQGYFSNNKKSLTSGSVYGRTDSLDWLLNGYYNDSDNYKLGNGKELSNSASREQGGMAKLGWQLNDDNRFEFDALHSTSDARVPSNPTANASTSVLPIDRNSKNTNLSFTYQFDPDSRLIDSRLQIFNTNTQFDEKRYTKGQKDSTKYKTQGIAWTNQSLFNQLRYDLWG